MNGNAPSPDYMAQIASTFGGAPPPGPIMLGGPPMAPPPVAAVPPPDPGMSVMPPPGPPPMNLASTPAPPPPPVAPAPPPGPRPFLQQVHGAGAVAVPAKETELRGPTLRGAQGERNAAFEGAVKAVTERSQETAAGDFAVALEQERRAGIQEDAANYTAAERSDEMAMRQADFDQSVKAMGEAGTIDNSRFFSSAGAGQKIAMMAALLVGGLAEAKGARNTGAEAIKAIAANDVKAQEFAYNATRDTANAKQTAFSMAMQKFNNADAARAAARAASMDVISAQVAKQAALWKGTDAANRAEMALAALQDERMQQVAQGVAFTPARTVGVGAQFRGADGLMYSEQEAKGLSKEMRGQGFELEKQGAGIAGQMMVEGAKVDKAGEKDARAEMVTLPNGDTVRAPSAVEAGKVRDLSAAASQINKLTARAKEIRADGTWRASPSARAELENVQSRLMTSFSAAANLGALSKDDLKIAEAATGDLFSLTPGVEAKLDAYNSQAQSAVRDRVKTYPDAPGSAKGEMPSSFTPHGKK